MAGGDTYSSQITNLSLTVVSKKLDKVIVRSTARLGDKIYITGSVGLSFLGYKTLTQKKEKLNLIEKIGVRKHQSPRSRIDLFATLIQNHSIHSMMDCTDGLVQDLQKYSRAAGKHFRIEAEKLPGWNQIRKSLSSLEILTSGEELELVFTTKERIPVELAQEIGRVESGKGVHFYEFGKKITITEEGFSHF